jgi:hypothetical protein
VFESFQFFGFKDIDIEVHLFRSACLLSCLELAMCELDLIFFANFPDNPGKRVSRSTYDTSQNVQGL